ncbi:hypothetical protein AGOR_G00244440 [Albula goreensis]|uniref:DUF4657 domain-containing protein n=1 Tax=Albula goreensis TaxID=1534307 RepID=A0A8T3CDH3_9TELE|nr:hypothetical protein AGOR_G00244440 [Albula goreensis]
MNLYRNFGNMLETWVVSTCPEINCEDTVASESQRQTLKGEAERRKAWMSPEVVGAIVRSESEDSGVEMACSEGENTVFTAQGSPSTPQGSDHGFSTVKQMDTCPLHEKVTPPFNAPSSSSSSSSSLSAVAPRKPDPLVARLRVEQALWRADQAGQWGRRAAISSQPPTLSTLSRTDSGNYDTGYNIPPLPCRSMTLSSRLNPRLGKQVPLKAVHPPILTKQNPELLRHPSSLKDLSVPHLSGNESGFQLCGEEGAGLCGMPAGEWPSPGLGYLEQVCRLLEEISRLQACNQKLRRENETFQNQLKAQGCQESPSQDLSCCPQNPVAVNESPETQRCNDVLDHPSHKDQLLLPCPRQRSASDTGALIRSKGEKDERSAQNTSTEGGLEESDSAEQYEPKQTQQGRRSNLLQKLKTVSLNRDTALLKPVRQPAFPSSKNGSKRPFGLLFKTKRTKTMTAL